MSNEHHPIRIVIADEQSSFRQNLRRSLESEPSVQIIGESSDARGAVQLARQSKPDILLVDFALSRGLERGALNESEGHLPPVRVVVTVTTIEKADLVEAFRLGAHGVVLKRSTPPVLLKSIRSVMAGQYWLE